MSRQGNGEGFENFRKRGHFDDEQGPGSARSGFASRFGRQGRPEPKFKPVGMSGAPAGKEPDMSPKPEVPVPPVEVSAPEAIRASGPDAEIIEADSTYETGIVEIDTNQFKPLGTKDRQLLSELSELAQEKPSSKLWDKGLTDLMKKVGFTIIDRSKNRMTATVRFDKGGTPEEFETSPRKAIEILSKLTWKNGEPPRRKSVKPSAELSKTVPNEEAPAVDHRTEFDPVTGLELPVWMPRLPELYLWSAEKERAPEIYDKNEWPEWLKGALHDIDPNAQEPAQRRDRSWRATYTIPTAEGKKKVTTGASGLIQYIRSLNDRILEIKEQSAATESPKEVTNEPGENPDTPGKGRRWIPDVDARKRINLYRLPEKLREHLEWEMQGGEGAGPANEEMPMDAVDQIGPMQGVGNVPEQSPTPQEAGNLTSADREYIETTYITSDGLEKLQDEGEWPSELVEALRSFDPNLTGPEKKDDTIFYNVHLDDSSPPTRLSKRGAAYFLREHLKALELLEGLDGGVENPWQALETRSVQPPDVVPQQSANALSHEPGSVVGVNERAGDSQPKEFNANREIVGGTPHQEGETEQRIESDTLEEVHFVLPEPNDSVKLLIQRWVDRAAASEGRALAGWETQKIAYEHMGVSVEVIPPGDYARLTQPSDIDAGLEMIELSKADGLRLLVAGISLYDNDRKLTEYEGVPLELESDGDESSTKRIRIFKPIDPRLSDYEKKMIRIGRVSGVQEFPKEQRSEDVIDSLDWDGYEDGENADTEGGAAARVIERWGPFNRPTAETRAFYNEYKNNKIGESEEEEKAWQERLLKALQQVGFTVDNLHESEYKAWYVTLSRQKGDGKKQTMTVHDAFRLLGEIICAVEGEQAFEEPTKRSLVEMRRDEGPRVQDVPEQVVAEDVGNIPMPRDRNRDTFEARRRRAEDVRITERFFDERFSTEFGITRNELENIEGFDSLSSAQQKLVYENLKEYADRGRKPYLGWVWEGIKGAFGNKGENIPVHGSKGMGAYGDIVRQLIRGVATYGPKVHEEGGELIPAFIDVDLQGKREHRADIQKALAEFNTEAHRMSNTPASWLEDGIGTHSRRESKLMSFLKNNFSGARKNYNAYQERQSAYEAVKQNLDEVLRNAGVDKGEIVQKLLEADKKVFELQFIQTSPDAVEAIQNIPDTGMWREIGKSLVDKSNLIYLGAGYLGRTAISGALGLWAAPAVSASLAGTRAWNRAAAELRERDRAARVGSNDTSAEALNIVSARRTVEIGGKTKEVGLTQKLEDLVMAYKNSPENAGLLNELKARTQYVEDKLKLNRINFGTVAERNTNVTKLFEILATAKVVIADRDATSAERGEKKYLNRSALEYRLENMLRHREDVIQGNRRALQGKKVAWNALRAGAFAYAGAKLAEYVRASEWGDKFNRLLSTESRPSAESTQGVTATEPQGSALPEGVEPQGGIEAKVFEPYRVTRGDTLTGILKEKVPALAELGTPAAKENAIANILQSLTPEELKGIGVTSGNVDLIRADHDTINLEKLNEIVESRRTFINRAIERFGGGVPNDPRAMDPGTDLFGYKGLTPDGELKTPWSLDLPPPESSVDLVDPLIAKKADILLNHFVSENLAAPEWNRIQAMRVDGLIAYAQSPASLDARSSIEWRLGTVFKLLGQPPYKLVPHQGERTGPFLSRVFLELVKKNENGVFPEDVRRMFDSVDLAKV